MSNTHSTAARNAACDDVTALIKTSGRLTATCPSLTYTALSA